MLDMHAALRRYTEDAEMKREAANDAWLFSISSGKWTQVQYAPGDVPRVSASFACPAALYPYNV
jgi:hypothetical protein